MFDPVMLAWVVVLSVLLSIIIGVVYRLIKGAFSCIAMAITAVIIAAGILFVLHLGGAL